jgi:hypothetical protein
MVDGEEADIVTDGGYCCSEDVLAVATLACAYFRRLHGQAPEPELRLRRKSRDNKKPAHSS